MNSVLDTIENWIQRGDRVAVATVVDTKKSAPQPAGTKMGINELGEVVGAVSGGCVEGAVVEVAERIIDGDEPQLLHYGIADEDAWDVGLPCGGEISVWVQNYVSGEAAGALHRTGAERCAGCTCDGRGGLQGDRRAHAGPPRQRSRGHAGR